MKRIVFSLLAMVVSLTLAAKPLSSPFAGYLFAYFEGGGDHNLMEQLRFAVSEDAQNWYALNDNRPIVASDSISESGGIRDPHILRGEDGCYYIVGRMGRFLKLFGMRVGLDECERIVKGKYPNLECACVGTDEKMIVYLTDESYQAQVKEELVNRLKLVASSFEVRIIDEIPKNEAGKILYAKLENK
jgi:acyl-CoA synthetase (AMP-forming)/AMP-acid ligase II